GTEESDESHGGIFKLLQNALIPSELGDDYVVVQERQHVSIGPLEAPLVGIHHAHVLSEPHGVLCGFCEPPSLDTVLPLRLEDSGDAVVHVQMLQNENLSLTVVR